MARSEKKTRRLVVNGQVFLWSVGHSHRELGNGRYEDCCESIVLRLFKARGRIRIVFGSGPDRFVAGGYPAPSGTVGTAGAESRFLNLHEPGTARALLDEALAQGWRPNEPVIQETDGWTLFEAVAARRGA